jgi:hypothetical protein
MDAQHILSYIEIASHNDCASCVRARYIEALRLAHLRLQNEKENYAHNAIKLQEYALEYVKRDLLCFMCMCKQEKESAINKLEEEKK